MLLYRIQPWCSFQCARMFCSVPHQDTSSIDPKEAIKEQNRQYYLKNKAEILEKRRIYRLNNREKIRQISREYFQRNRDAILQRNKEQCRQQYIKRTGRFYLDNCSPKKWYVVNQEVFCFDKILVNLGINQNMCESFSNHSTCLYTSTPSLIGTGYQQDK